MTAEQRPGQPAEGQQPFGGGTNAPRPDEPQPIHSPPGIDALPLGAHPSPQGQQLGRSQEGQRLDRQGLSEIWNVHEAELLPEQIRNLGHFLYSSLFTQLAPHILVEELTEEEESEGTNWDKLRQQPAAVYVQRCAQGIGLSSRPTPPLAQHRLH